MHHFMIEIDSKSEVGYLLVRGMKGMGRRLAREIRSETITYLTKSPVASASDRATSDISRPILASTISLPGPFSALRSDISAAPRVLAISPFLSQKHDFDDFEGHSVRKMISNKFKEILKTI